MKEDCSKCEQGKFLKCGTLSKNIKLYKSNIKDLTMMLEFIPEEYRNESKIVIMRLDKNTNDWYAWLCKTDIAIDVGAECNINNLILSDVLNLVAHYGCKVEVRYDYFLDYD